MQSHYRPGQALRVPGVWGSQISRHSAHEGGKGRQPYALATFIHQEIIMVLISVRGWVNPRGNSEPERFMSMKNSVDTNRNRTGDLLACNVVPQPTVPPRTPQGRNGTVSKHIFCDRICCWFTRVWLSLDTRIGLWNYQCQGVLFLGFLLRPTKRRDDLSNFFFF
jgi:hypothetical protein